MFSVCGDLHGEWERIMRAKVLYRQISQEDFLLILGDFGVVWDGSDKESRVLDALDALPFTILFLDGNHENFNLLEEFPVDEWNGGIVHVIRPSILHLIRGEIYSVENHSLFVFGGAESHDFDMILDRADPQFERTRSRVNRDGLSYRIRGSSYWDQELPSIEECERARKNLEAHHNKVDYIFTHCGPTSLQRLLEPQELCYKQNILTEFLEEVKQKVKFKGWYFGHYHVEKDLLEKYHIRYKDIERIF